MPRKRKHLDNIWSRYIPASELRVDPSTGRSVGPDGRATGVLVLPELTVTPRTVSGSLGAMPSQYDMIHADDKYNNSYVLDTGDFLNAITLGGLNNLSPTQWARRLYDLAPLIKGDMSSSDYINRWTFGNEGVVSKDYESNHPIKAAALNLLGDIALAGGAKGTKELVRIGKNIKDRNKFAYKYITPFSYYNPFDRGKNLINHILKDPSFVKGEIPEPVIDYGTPAIVQERMGIDPQTIFRDEAWRKYLGLPERLGLYVDNGDGTFRYNKSIVDKISKGNLIADIPKGDNNFVNTWVDYLTGNGGHIKLTRQKTNKGFIDTLEDIWDLHPFTKTKYTKSPIEQAIDSKVVSTANNIYTKLYDRGLYRNRFGYNWLGGKLLNKLRYEFDSSKLKSVQAIQKKLEKTEMGKLLGGTPFKMKTKVYLDVPTLDAPMEAITPYMRYKYGGTIHIKPENRGKFNALKKRTGKTTEELTHSKNPLTRKRAIFAQNARKWNHKKK